MKLSIWTDGAISSRLENKPGGWASVYVYEGIYVCENHEGVLDTTSQRMELMGCLMGFRNILNHEELKELEYDTIIIHSDSAYLINCMTQKWFINWRYNGWISHNDNQPVKNRDLWEAILNEVDLINKKGIHISWHKVKGHKGLLYNEMADKLAVKAKKGINK